MEYFKLEDWTSKLSDSIDFISKNISIVDGEGLKILYHELYHDSVLIKGGCPVWQGFILDLDEALRSDKVTQLAIPNLSRLNPELSQLNPNLSRLNPELSQIIPKL